MSEPTKEEIDRLKARCAEACAKLMEEFDAVQLLVTWADGDRNTHMIQWGRGNWYARRGMADTFCERDRGENMSVSEEDEG